MFKVKPSLKQAIMLGIFGRQAGGEALSGFWLIILDNIQI